MIRVFIAITPSLALQQSFAEVRAAFQRQTLQMGLEPHPALTQLQQRLEAELTPLRFAPEERAFRPHLTLARMQHGRGRTQLGPLLQTYHTHGFGEVAVEQLHLFQSQLHREGAVYTMLHSVMLQR
jgi:2'-5' RNA ligase